MTAPQSQTAALPLVPGHVSYDQAVLAIHSLSGKRPNPAFQNTERPVPRREQKVSEFLPVSQNDVFTACALAGVNPEGLDDDALFSQLMGLILRGDDIQLYVVRNRQLLRQIHVHDRIGIDGLNDTVLNLQQNDRVVIYCKSKPQRFADIIAKYQYVSSKLLAYHIH